MAKNAYIVLVHKFRPAPGENTSMKDFLNKGNWEMFEEVFFVTRIRKRWWQEATTIINITSGKIETNRSDTREYKDIMQHVIITYPTHYNNFLKECKDEGLVMKGRRTQDSGEV